jgi:plastocyanin
MRRGLSILIACSALLLAAGCGSSKSSTTSSSAQGTSTPASTSGELKTTTTPKFAAPAASAPVQGGVVQVAYRDITIQPDTLKVKVGTTVRWTNYDSVEHNVTTESGSQHFASKDFGESGSGWRRRWPGRPRYG